MQFALDSHCGLPNTYVSTFLSQVPLDPSSHSEPTPLIPYNKRALPN